MSTPDFATIRVQAENGLIQAQTYLGYMLDRGKFGAPKDSKQAFQWFKKAADKNDGYALAYIGYMYEKGRGVSQNHIESFKYYYLSAESGSPDGKVGLGNRYEVRIGDFAEAERLYKEAAESDEAPLAHLYLGYLYERGGGGNGKDVETPYLQLEMKLMTSNSNGPERYSERKRTSPVKIAQNLKLAAESYKKFHQHKHKKEAIESLLDDANEGYPEEQFFMGLLCERGIAVEQDLAQAYCWYTLAAEGKHEAAKKNLEELIKPSFYTRCLFGKTPLPKDVITKGETLVKEWKQMYKKG